ncbi:MAG: hypothetical protein U0R70_00575 [Solirubrobacteraceae bacterium]
MTRGQRIAVIAFAVLAFVVVSFVLARVLTAGNAERSAAIDVVQDEARGSTAAVAGAIDGCDADAACTARVARVVHRVRRPGKVEILRVDGTGGLEPFGRTTVARVAWKAGDTLPVVQCVSLKRSGDPLTGFEVTVTGVSPPIGRQASC